VCVLHCRYHEFEPTDVGVVVLPNGQRAVTYTRQSQTGHGDHREANVEIDKIIRKTKHLQVPSRARVCVCVCVCVCYNYTYIASTPRIRRTLGSISVLCSLVLLFSTF